MGIKPRRLKVGNDSVVIGDVAGEVGDGSVVIGATDDRGNVILNSSMAIGRGAFAGPGSVAIGVGAGAGMGAQLPFIVNQLADAVEAAHDDDITERFNTLVAELETGRPDKGRVATILQYLGSASALNGVWSLVERIQHVVVGHI